MQFEAAKYGRVVGNMLISVFSCHQFSLAQAALEKRKKVETIKSASKMH